MKKPLEVEAVALFLLVADLRSFSRAAESQGITQSAASLKIKRLEDSLGHRLLVRTPRQVRLSENGQRFLGPARDFLAAHRLAQTAFGTEALRLVVGISHHVVGGELPALLKQVGEADPGLVLEVRIANSWDVLADYDRGGLDAAFVLQHDPGRRDGEVVMAEPFAWMAAPSYAERAAPPLRLATQSAPCSVRALAVKALDDAGIAWTETFIGGGVATVGAAVAAGLGVAALSRRVAPPGTVDVGGRLGLPDLPMPILAVFSRVAEGRARAAIRSLTAAFRASAGA